MNSQDNPKPPPLPNRKFGAPAARVKSLVAMLGGAAVMTTIAAVALGYAAYTCFRIDVPPEHVAVLIKRTGEDLPNQQVLAASPAQKGVQLDVLTEGRYFY